MRKGYILIVSSVVLAVISTGGCLLVGWLSDGQHTGLREAEIFICCMWAMLSALAAIGCGVHGVASFFDS